MGNSIQIRVASDMARIRADFAGLSKDLSAAFGRNPLGGVNQEMGRLQAAIPPLRYSVVQMGIETDMSLAKAHEGARLLEVMLGVRLPRAVTTAVGTMIPAIGSLSYYLIGIFAAREFAEAFTNWDTFKDKVTGLLGPFSELEVQIANAFGFLTGYSKEARNKAEQDQKDADDGLKLAVRQTEAQNNLNLLRSQGAEKIRLESAQRIQALERELSLTDQSNKAYYQGLIQVERQTEAVKEQQYFIEEAKKAEAKSTQDVERYTEAVNRFTEDWLHRMIEAGSITRTIQMDMETHTATLAKGGETLNKVDLDYLYLLDQISGREQNQIQVSRSLGEMMQADVTQTVHLSEARRVHAMMTQDLSKAESILTISQHDSEAATESSTAAAMEGAMSSAAALIAGRKAAAIVEGAWDIAKGAEQIAMALDPYDPYHAQHYASAAQYFVAAASMGVIASSGGGRGGGGGGGGGSQSNYGRSGGSGRGGSDGSGGGASMPGAAGGGTTFHVNIQGLMSSDTLPQIMAQMTQLAKGGQAYLVSSDTFGSGPKQA